MKTECLICKGISIDLSSCTNVFNPGVQLLGSTAKNIAKSCEISPYVTLKEKSTSPYFFRFQKFTFDFDHSDSLLIVYSSQITPVFAHGDTADCQLTLNRLPLLINPYAMIG